MSTGGARAEVVTWDGRLPDEPVTFIGIEAPEDMPDGSEAYALDRLSELIPEYAATAEAMRALPVPFDSGPPRKWRIWYSAPALSSAVACQTQDSFRYIPI